ncbi:class I SAM-dependent methyltransferase [Arthrobacter sp. H20]|uniref:class I SAM-dependent methyltransferase n=1 Tax=Arthrobacter sp. H20 TaxID=1267981 RepID=UPI00047CB6C4|nr:class I SAM-dependent methyltransferase [Arthrobacter sp. H20]
MPRGGPRLHVTRRIHLAGGYLNGGEQYDRVRPGYPAESVDWVLAAGALTAADVGAGTGLFTAELVKRGLDVTAVDPSHDMLDVLRSKLPQVTTVVGTAESTGLATASVQLVSIAQAWHWLDPAAAARESARILVPGGSIALLWNQLDVSLPWVHRLSRIMHAGDVYRPDHRPTIGQNFGPPEHLSNRWTQTLITADIVELAKSRSYYRRATPAIRAKVEANLDWYLHEHLGFIPEAAVELPYFTHVWRASRT